MTDSTRLDGEVAIVTGAAQGIGRGIALVLAEAGAKVVIGDIQDASATVQEILSHGGEALSMVMDTSRSSDAQALVALALTTYGRLDILVNNAAIDAPSGNAWDLSDEDWQRTIDVNVSGVFYCSRAALEPMLAAGKGCIVNLSSQSARIGAKGLSPAYNTSKAAVLGLTVAFSAQVAERGVRVNA
ncbi:MAG: SDR family oxidoreductase, partial [Candidatus Tectomicrobia bacterium]|nr:SDR family oxidoreductase [Candidatus Tectomicrobia bacterium]